VRPLLALSPDGGRAYLLGLPDDAVAVTGGRGPGVDVVDTASMRPLERWDPGPSEAREIVLSPDGQLAYLATGPFSGDPGRRTVALAVRQTADGAIRLVAGRLPAGVDNPLLPLIVR
jgi:hypothetical protein